MKHTLPCAPTQCMKLPVLFLKAYDVTLQAHELKNTEHNISGVGFIVWKRYLILDMYTNKITAREIHMKIFTESRPVVKVKFPCNFQCEFYVKSCFHKNFTHIFLKMKFSRKTTWISSEINVVILPV